MSRPSPTRALLAAPALLLAPACVLVVNDADRPREVGSGRVATEVRAAAPFEAVEVAGALAVEVRVGEPCSVLLTGDDNLLWCVETRVRDGVLHVDQVCDFSSREGLRVVVTTPELRRLELSGANRVELRGAAGEALSIDASGANELAAYGAVDALAVDASGAASLHLFGLAARRARVEASGGAAVELDASERLEVDAEGGVSIRYRGRPSLSVRQSGSVSLQHVE